MTNPNEKRLAGKKMVITGGSTGIGFETAKTAIAAGARVLISSSREQNVSNAVKHLGNGAIGVAADVTDLAALGRFADKAKSEFATVDILFANAGLGAFMPIEEVDEATFDRQFDVNVKGAYFTVQKMLPLMCEGGSIILMASAVNAKGLASGSLYFATKAAVRSFVRSLAAELGPRGIRVNALSPGIVRTPFQERAGLDDESATAYVDMVVAQAPLGRAGTMADMANAAVFLASDESAYMTAADLVVDGGWMNV